MKNDITLSIPEPCTEKWESFTPAAGGGFCSSCSKVVIDFTTSSDEEIMNFFASKPAHACGKFRPHQLKVYAGTMAMAKVNPGTTLLKAGLMSLLMLLISKQTHAQDMLAKAKTEVVQYPQQTTLLKADTKINQVFKGVVKDESGETMPGVNVLLKGTTNGTITDANGRFEFNGEFKVGDVFEFSFVGYDRQEYKISKDFNGTVEIALIMDMQVMGKVAVLGPYEPEATGFKKIWTKVKSVF